MEVLKNVPSCVDRPLVSTQADPVWTDCSTQALGQGSINRFRAHC